jgi:hypothetical protein
MTQRIYLVIQKKKVKCANLRFENVEEKYLVNNKSKILCTVGIQRLPIGRDKLTCKQLISRGSPLNSCCIISQAMAMSHCSSEVRASGRLRRTENCWRYLVAAEGTFLHIITARFSEPCFSCTHIVRAEFMCCVGHV